MSQVLSLIMAPEDQMDETSQMHILARVQQLEFGPLFQKFCELPPPRLGKVHLPWHLVQHWVTEDKVKTIVTLRNPKDTLVSYYHFHTINPAMGQFQGSWTDFFNATMEEAQIYGDIVNWSHDWWTQRERHNVLIVKYEDLVSGRREKIKKIAEFLGKSLNDEQLDQVYRLTGFNEMKGNVGTNFKSEPMLDQKKSEFIRKGKVGDWKDYFTVEQNERFDQKYQSILEAAGLEYSWG